MVRQAAQAILHGIPPELRAAWNQGAPTRWIADPMPLHDLSAQAVRGWSRCRPARHRCGCWPMKRPKRWPAWRVPSRA